MMSCMLVLYLAVSQRSIGSGDARANASPLSAVQRALPCRCRPGRALCGPGGSREGARAADDLGRAPAGQPARFRRRHGSSRARVTGWAGTRRKPSARRCSKRGSPPAVPPSRCEPNRPEGHFWLAANMGALAESFGMRQGTQVPRRHQGRAADWSSRSIRRFSKGRPTARSAAGTSRCPDSSAAQQQEVRRAPPKVADLQPEQHGLAFLPGRNADRHGSHSRRARRAAAGHRRSDRTRTGPPRIESSKRRPVQLLVTHPLAVRAHPLQSISPIYLRRNAERRELSSRIPSYTGGRQIPGRRRRTWRRQRSSED